MIKEFYSREDLQRNFSNCLVDYEGKLYYTSLCPRKVAIQLSSVTPDGVISPEVDKVVDFNGKDRDIILKTPKLGWILWENQPLFLFRNCRRQFLFGATGKTVEYATITAATTRTFGDFLYEPAVLRQIQLKERKYEKEGPISQIFSHRYAVFDGDLYREREIVGKVDERGLVKFINEYTDTLTVIDLERLGLNEDRTVTI